MPEHNLQNNSDAIVQTDAGPVRGIAHENYLLFQGIPYAAPPVEALRWCSPQPVEPWLELRDATKPGNISPQIVSTMSGSRGGGSEDCLYLNVVVPRSANPRQLKPVMLWLHGGGPDGNGTDCDARRLALTGDVIVVTINYRLGIFGFFNYPGLTNGGSFGLEDQQAALRWVQRNAVAFGGDPHNVTLFGESYGGFSIDAHLTSPTAAGLFQRAITQSAPCMISYPANSIFPGISAVPSIWRSSAEVEELAIWLASEKLGDTDLDALRRLPVDALLPHTRLFTAPAFGTPLLPDNPIQSLREGRFHRVPIISGITRDEYRFFIAYSYNLAGQPVTPDRYFELLKEAFADSADLVAARYPLSDYLSPGLAWATVLTDRIYADPIFEQNQLFAQYMPTYAYEFADNQAPHVTFPFPPALPGGAFHASELMYLFDFGDKPAPFAEEQLHLSTQMMQYWTNFARTGDPNGSGLPVWPRFRNTDAIPHVQSLAPGPNGIKGVNQAATHHLDLWSRLRSSDVTITT